ncbi:MAG: hypothetical protein ABS976_14780 [Rhodococcus sp. (in: high G+C Gram-positive bacteria)]
MAGGQQVDPGKLSGVGSAYSQEGKELGSAAGKVKAGVGEGQIGKLWTDMAEKYADAIEKYAKAMKQYGEKVGNLGGNFSKAAKSYESGEAVSVDAITSAGKGAS